MALKRMDNVGIVVDDLGATIDFFRELGLELEGRAMVEGEWAGRVTGLGDQRVAADSPRSSRCKRCAGSARAGARSSMRRHGRGLAQP
jgi:catechol 2,3-dioxygenase-like lactoylglutathione lyase family enzyme